MSCIRKYENDITHCPIHVMQIVGDPIGGLRKHVHSIINRLDSKRFVQSYAYSTTAQDEKFCREIGPLQSHLLGSVPLRIRKRPHPSDLLNLVKLINYCRNNGVDVLHGHGAKGGMYARIVGKICRVPAIYTPHGGVAHYMFSYWEDKLYIYVEKFLERFTHCYIFESKYTAESFQSKVGKINTQWLVNYNGIDCPPIVNMQKQETLDQHAVKNIGVFAMLRKEKGQIHLINAVASIVNSGQAKVMLHIYGNGPDRGALEIRVKDLGITENVTFYGDISNPEQEMAKMDIIAIPSIFESFGYVGLEAMALGKPVIASAVGGLKEIFNSETALLVTPKDEIALAQAIILGIQNPVSSGAMAQRGHSRCKNVFSLNSMIEVLSNQYRNAVSI